MMILLVVKRGFIPFVQHRTLVTIKQSITNLTLFTTARLFSIGSIFESFARRRFDQGDENMRLHIHAVKRSVQTM